MKKVFFIIFFVFILCSCAFLQKIMKPRSQCFCLSYDKIRTLAPDEVKKKLKFGLLSKYWNSIQDTLISAKYKSFYKDIGPSLLDLQNIRYVNGKNFGEVCIIGDVSLNKDRWNKYKPHEFVLKNFCYSCGDLKVKKVALKAQIVALKKLIEKYFPDSRGKSFSEIKKAVLKTEVKNARFNLSKNVICFQFRAVLVPGMLKKTFTPLSYNITKSSKNSFLKQSFFLDLKKYNVGDFLPQYGEYLVIQQGSEGKGISTLNEAGTTATFKVPKGENFKLDIYFYHNISLNFGFLNKIIYPFKFRYDNYVNDVFQIILQKKENSPLKAIFQMNTNIANLDSFYLARNFNEYKFVKQNNNFKIFSNGSYVATFFTSGKRLKNIVVRLNRGDILYKIKYKVLVHKKRHKK